MLILKDIIDYINNIFDATEEFFFDHVSDLEDEDDYNRDLFGL